MMRSKHRNSLKKLFYVEIHLNLIELLIVGQEFAQEQPENGLTAWVISGKRYKKEFFIIDMNEKMMWSIERYFLGK